MLYIILAFFYLFVLCVGRTLQLFGKSVPFTRKPVCHSIPMTRLSLYIYIDRNLKKGLEPNHIFISRRLFLL